MCPNSEEVCFVEDEKQKKIYTTYQITNDIYLGIVSPHFDVKLSGKFVEKVRKFNLNYKVYNSSNLH